MDLSTLGWPTLDLANPAAWLAFAQVLVIDVVLAGDNALVVGVAAAGLPADLRRRAILVGVGAAVVLRIALALIATQLLDIVGLTLAGGILLLWVCWKLYRELRASDAAGHGDWSAEPAPKTLRAAIVQIVVADLSMSLDNVLAVAGAASEHPWVLVVGLVVSVALMGAAASLIARLLQRYRWIAWVGVVIIVGVALKMIWSGSLEVQAVLARFV